MWHSLGKALFIFALLSATAIAQELPSDAQKLVKDFEKSTGLVRLKADTENDEAVAAALKSLAMIQDKLTRAGQLDEAVAVRDQLKKAGRPAWDDAKTRALFELNTGLPEEAAALLVRVAKEAQERSATADKATTAAREALNTKLSELLKSYSEAGKLDEAIAVRNQLRRLSASTSGSSVSTSAPSQVASVTTSLEEREKAAAAEAARFKVTSPADAFQHSMQFHAHQTKELDAEFESGLAEVRSKLLEQQTSHTKAGRLNEAVAIRDLLSSLDMASQLAKQPAEHAAGQRKILSGIGSGSKLPGDMLKLVNSLLRADTTRASEAARVRTAFTAPLTAQLESLAGRSLIAGDIEKARGELSQIASFQGRSFAFGWPGHRPVVKTPESFAPSLDAFHKASEERWNKADAQEATLRKALLAALRDVKSEVETEQAAVSKTITILDADWSVGLRGLLLLTVDRKLPAETLVAVQTFVSSTRDLRVALQKEQEAALKQFKVESQSIVEKLVKDLELEAAFAVLEGQKTLHRVFEPLPLKAFRNGHRGHAWDAELVDFRQGELLIRWIQGSGEEWVTRDMIAMDGDFELRTITNIESPGASKASAPGEAVTAKTPLKTGQKLRGEWAGRWLPVTVMALSPSGVKIHWQDYPDGFDEFVSRSRLRIVDDE